VIAMTFSPDAAYAYIQQSSKSVPLVVADHLTFL
jgi:hypothetical protein